MNRLVFADPLPVQASDPNRADITLFVGFVARRSTPVPGGIRDWLIHNGWLSRPLSPSNAPVEPAGWEDLLDLPVPIDTWDVFDHLFRWESRPLASGPGGSTYLGAAVRTYFAQGGRKCYVVRVGDPWPFQTARAARLGRIEQLIPGYPSIFAGSPVDRFSWHGCGHLFGLPDVSFLCLPDLVDVVAADPDPIGEADEPPALEEQFVECSEPEPPPPADRPARRLNAPRCDDAGHADWVTAVRLVANLLARQRREVQLVVALPIPVVGTAAERDPLGFLVDRGRGPLTGRPDHRMDGIASAFVQIAYPWARTPGSADLPEQLEGPDGILTGVLARNALLRGTYRSAAGLHLADLTDIYPELRRDQLLNPPAGGLAGVAGTRGLLDRISILGRSPAGLVLLSDVTTSLDESYRPGGVSRLVAVIVRAARRLGEDLVFDVSGEAVWLRLRESLNRLLLGLLQDGALHGTTPDEAYQVRCDRTTMSQNDLENGRIIARVQFTAAAPIERITVVLAMDEGGQVSLVSTAGPEAA